MTSCRHIGLTAGITLALTAGLGAQSPPSAAMDNLLEHLVGHWTMTGPVRGTPETYAMDAARVLIGVDSGGGRYLAHRLDSFGAAYSIPHATGSAHGDTAWFAAIPAMQLAATIAVERGTQRPDSGTDVGVVAQRTWHSLARRHLHVYL